MNSWLNNANKGLESIRSCAGALQFYADSFGHVGNAKMQRKLNAIANDLMEQQEKINDAIHQKLDDDIRCVQESEKETRAFMLELPKFVDRIKEKTKQEQQK